MASVKQLVLASGSPFRRALLASTGLSFRVEVADVDETSIAGLPPRQLALGRAELKAVAVARGMREALVIGADQVLSFEGRTFDKAKTAEEAAQRLAELSGRTHILHSAVTLVPGAGLGRDAVCASFVIEVPMPMRPLSSAEIAAYVATDEWRGAVGCYQFENRGVHLFDGVDADHSAIVGLPLQRLLKELRLLGVNALTAAMPPWELLF